MNNNDKNYKYFKKEENNLKKKFSKEFVGKYIIQKK